MASGFDSTLGCRQTQPTSGWYVIYTRHQHEKTIAGALVNKAFDAFVPLYAVVHRWRDRSKRLLLPLFPCYVFVRDCLNRQTQILVTPGVHWFIGFNGRPAEIPAHEMEALFRMVASSLRLEPHPFLKCGDRVRIRCGPLEGIEGTLIRKMGLWRLVLSVDMLQRAVAVQIDSSIVEPISDSRSNACWRGVNDSDPNHARRTFAV